MEFKKQIDRQFNLLTSSINELVEYNSIDEKIKRLCKIFDKKDLSFINFCDSGYSIYLDDNKCSYGRTIQDVINELFNDYKAEIEVLEKELENEM